MTISSLRRFVVSVIRSMSIFFFMHRRTTKDTMHQKSKKNLPIVLHPSDFGVLYNRLFPNPRSVNLCFVLYSMLVTTSSHQFHTPASPFRLSVTHWNIMSRAFPMGLCQLLWSGLKYVGHWSGSLAPSVRWRLCNRDIGTCSEDNRTIGSQGRHLELVASNFKLKIWSK